ncbi:hypothetical protein QLX67_03730 [Balneolaceae bacterium ANBcel3]|nr:hypothetical protein [Balneolaceae bacterium ANBcel3]
MKRNRPHTTAKVLTLDSTSIWGSTPVPFSVNPAVFSSFDAVIRIVLVVSTIILGIDLLIGVL